VKKEILIVKNITREGPGLLEDVLKEIGISYSIIDLSKEMDLPQIETYGAVIVLGGPDSANDENEKMKNELTFIHTVISSKIPFLGICLGFQALVKAAGGLVVKNPVKEVGFKDPTGNNFTIELTKEGEQDPLFKGLERTFKVFHLHGETVELGDNMVLLATGKFCRSQVVRVSSNAYGIQSHFELTDEMFERWINEDHDLLQLNKEDLRTDFKEIENEYTRTGKQLFRNFLKIAGY
jgi:GMP synthase (glutamine-hydrolysing)